MKTVSLKNIEWLPSPNYTKGRSQKINAIVIHHFDDPAKKPTMNGVISWFKNPNSQVSAHFVVSNDRVVQMVSGNNTAWHSLQANSHTIGIEVDPRGQEKTYETVGALVKFLRDLYKKDFPLHPHSKYVATQCPGSISIKKINDYAYGRIEDMSKIKELEKEVKKYRDAWQTESKKRAKLEKAVVRNNEDIKALVKEQERLRQENSDTKVALEKAQTENRDHAKQVNNLETEVGRLEKANTKLNEENKRLKKDVTVKDAISVIIDKIVSLIRR